jgi:peptidylprolyl isomerase
MPTVVFAPDGTPGVTMPKTAAPSELKLNTLVDGSGAPIALGDTVTLNYSGFLWESGDVFDSSWTNGKPEQFQITQGGLIEGFVKALVGAKLGSKLVVVIPPDLGYGAQGNNTIPGNATLVFVIEVLGIDKPTK